MLNGRNILLTYALLLFVAPAAQSGTLVYVVTGGITGNGAFGTMDLSTGQFNQLGPIQPDGCDGLAPGPNGSLYTLTYAGNIVSINPGTGALPRKSARPGSALASSRPPLAVLTGDFCLEG
jgi:hypothetical protein